MNNILFNYVIQAILGGASGYITNDYAINMLFKEYTPLKIGGVIKKTRNEFIDNLSALMEDDIINKDKLKAAMSGDKFKQDFEKLTEDFFKDCLYQSVGSDKFSDIPSIDSSLKTTGEFINKILDNNLTQFIDLIFTNIKLEDMLTDEQLNSLFDNIMLSVLDTLENTTLFEDFMSHVYNTNKDLKLLTILGDSKDKVLNIVRNSVCELNVILRNNLDNEIEDFITNLYLSSRLMPSIAQCKDILFAKNFRDIISSDDDFFQNIGDNFKIYINSANGQNSLSDLCDTLFSYAKKSDKTLFDIADSTLEIKLKSYLTENLPKITSTLVVWILINKKGIEDMIESAVDEVIAEADGMKGKVLNTVRSSFLSNLSEKYKIVDKIIDYIKGETEPEKLSLKISSKIMEYLDSTTLKDIVISAESSNILTSAKTAQYITNYINEYSEVVVTEIKELILNLEIGKVLPNNMNVMDIMSLKIRNVLKNKILSSHSVTTSISDKACEYVITFLNTNMDDILNEESFDKNSYALKIKLLETLKLNSNNIRTVLVDEIKTVISDKTIKQFTSKVTVDNVSKLLSAETFKKYEQFSRDVKDANVSYAVDKINSIDNLYKNSSENLGNLISSNIDSLLSGSVKKIVSSNLNKLDDDQLCNMANDFIGKELRPIMYFGGILGTVAGIGLAAIQNSAPNFDAISFSNMATYALVGFSTNLIAINMIFKPYREIKALSKIPFLRNFSLGYIVKNQPVFATSMANVIDKNLLNNDSINELFNQYEDNIKASFAQSITNNNYMVFQNLLLKNHSDIVSASFKFSENLMTENVDNLAHFGLDKFGDINIHDILTTENTYYLSYLASKNTHVATDKLAPYLYSKIRSNHPISNILPNFISSYLKTKASNSVINNYDKIILQMGSIDSVKKFVMLYDGKYRSFITKPLEDIINIFTPDNVKLFVAHEAGEMILSKNVRQQISSGIIKIMESQLNGDKLFEEVFGGRIKNFIDSKLVTYFEKISCDLKDILHGFKDKVSTTVKDEIKSNLGFLEKGMYSIIGGNEVVDDIVTKIITVKAPIFIDSKKQEILDIFSGVVNDRLYKAKLKDLQISTSNIRVDNMVDTFFEDEANRDLVRTKVNGAVYNMSHHLFKLELKDILKIFSFGSIEDIFTTYNDEINSLLHALSSNLTDNKKEIIHKTLWLGNQIADNFFNNLSFDHICKDISEDDIKIILENIVDVINKDITLKTVFCNILCKYKEHIGKGKTLADFINDVELQNSLTLILKSLTSNEDVKKYIEDLYSSILSEVHQNNLEFIDDETKKYFVNILIDTGINSIKRNLPDLLKVIQLDTIAREEILEMEPETIHKMFNSFAEKYFGRLILYGLGGFIFGINVYLGLLLTVLKVSTSAVNKQLSKDK